jgi:hypothetical protein
MLAIEAATAVSAAWDSAGHLIFTRHDATQFDAGAVPASTTTLAGAVELATSTETTTGTDAVRAVTPSGLAAVKALLLSLTGGTMSGAITTMLSAATGVVHGANVSADTFDRWRVYADGKQEWGSGSGSRDTNLYRTSAGLLKTDNSLKVDTDLTVTGVFNGASNVSVGAWTSYTPTWTSAGTGTPALGNATVSCYYTKVGRKVDVRFEITFGSTTTFGNTGTGDNWQFTLPVTAARSGDSIGFLQLLQSNTITCMGRARTNSTTTFLISVASGRTDATAITNTGDVDSVTPWTWASANTVKGNFTYESAS